jgi:protein CpxP
MKKETLLTIIVLVLIALNVTLLVMFYIHQQRPPFSPPFMRGPGPDGRGPGKVIVDRLKFDESQRKELENLRQQHRDKVTAIQEEFRRLQDELFDQLKGQQRDTAKVSDIINSIGNNRKQFEQAIFDHFAAIKALCKTDEQKKLFDDFIGELGKMIGPPMPQPPDKIPPDGPPPEK